MKKIGIYGCGETAKWYMENYKFDSDVEFEFIETYRTKEVFLGQDVKLVGEVDLQEFDEIYILNMFVECIFILLQKQYPKEKIIICNKTAYLAYVDRVNGQTEIRYNNKVAEAYEKYMIERDKFEFSTTTVKYRAFPYEARSLALSDFCRYGTLSNIVNEIRKRNVQGDIAELGVFRGNFACVMNAMLGDRKLYLFDTFEGFPIDDVNNEKADNLANKDWDSEKFKFTSVEAAMSRMIYPEQCIVRKGYFPDTIPNENLEFALVSLDCDFYAALLEGLRYFYPRLNNGGYIMMHDYNNYNLHGAEKALSTYEEEIGITIPKVPIPDVSGTIVLCK